MDENLYQFATEAEKTYLDAIKEHGSKYAAADKLGKSRSSLRSAIRNLKKRAAKRGYSPDHDMKNTTPEGYIVKGISTLYDGDGNVKQQWVKTKEDNSRILDSIVQMVEKLCEPIEGLAPKVEQPKINNADLMCIYPIADAHLGMYSWSDETGDDWDSDKCSATLYETMSRLVEQAPTADTALIVNLADFFHCDNNSYKTERSGHILDVDTRWARVFMIGHETFRKMIELALQKHKTVIVKSAIGNHDEKTGIALMVAMKSYFKNEQRVKIEIPKNPFAYHRFGATLLGINHDVKADKLPMIMASDQRELWGETRFHHWLGGHIHHQTFHEYPGCTTETFRSPAAKDSWNHSMGYRSERDMVMIKVHKEKGIVGRIIEPIY